MSIRQFFKNLFGPQSGKKDATSPEMQQELDRVKKSALTAGVHIPSSGVPTSAELERAAASGRAKRGSH